jgi:hypothetical protein
MIQPGYLKGTLLFLLTIFFTIQSSRANIVILNGLTHENTAQTGESYRGSIQLQNTANAQKSVQIYLRDYWFAHTGESKHDPPGTMERSNAAWITFTPELITLEAGEIATVDFEVKIPDQQELKGTYWSVIMVEGIVPPDTSNFTSGVTIRTAIRYAVQIVTNIGNSGTSDLQFAGLELSKQNDTNVLQVILENTGERVLRPEVSIELFDESGNSVGTIKEGRKKTFPGTSIKTALVLEGIKPGSYTAILVADCDEDHNFGTNLSHEIG